MEVKPGYKQTEVGVIPEDWEVKRFGDIVKTCNKRIDPRKSDVQDFCIELEHIGSGTGSLIGSTSTKEHSSLKSVFDVGDVLFGKLRAYLKKYWLANCPGVCSTEIWIFSPKERNTTGKYLFQIVRTDLFTEVASSSYGTHMPRSDWNLVKNYRFPLPPTLAEQTAIAEALSDADALIEALEQLIAKKRLIKQGAMQELLTGKRRLPGFKGEWEEKRLGEVADIHKGELITAKTTIPGSIPVIAGGKEPAYFHNRANRNGKTITISGSGANAGFISFHCIPIFASDCSTISEGSNYDIDFIFYTLLLNQGAIYKSQTGGAQPHIHPSDLRPIVITIPKSKKEQTAIAAVLADMDAEITALEERLDKARQIKQGMMQELLTGRIRLV